MGINKFAFIFVLLLSVWGYWVYEDSSASLVLQSSKSHQIEDNLESSETVKLNAEISKEKTQPEVAINKSQTDTMISPPDLDAKLNLTDPTTKKSWSPYIKNDSDEYNEVLKKSFTSDGPVIIGENIYFKLLIDWNIVFSKINQSDAEAVLNDPFNTYNKLLNDLNEIEEYGDWSYQAELIVREIFNKNFNEGTFFINALQCREKTCLIELTYSIFGAADKFTDMLRYNRDLCDCNIAEYIWPEEMRAVCKIVLI
jgi:hypothetical protein